MTRDIDDEPAVAGESALTGEKPLGDETVLLEAASDAQNPSLESMRDPQQQPSTPPRFADHALGFDRLDTAAEPGGAIPAEPGDSAESSGGRFAPQLPSFNGPLDLLLYLIHKNEIDIFDIPIAEILTQYFEYLRRIEQSGTFDLNGAGEYLVMGARLMEIKSRLLLPPAFDEQEEEELLEAELEDPRVSLVQQLLDFKEIKERANLLEEIHDRRSQRYERVEGEQIPPPETVRDLGDVSLHDLCEAFSRVMEDLQARENIRVIEVDDVPIEEVIRGVRQRLEESESGSVIFRELIPEHASLGLLVTYFLSILEMARLQVLKLTQDEELGDIVLQRRASA